MFYEDLRNKLGEWGVTQAELAEELGRSKQTVNQWCLGRYLPSDEDIQKITNLFDMDISAYKQEMKNRPNLPNYIRTSSGDVFNDFDGKKLRKMRESKNLTRSQLGAKIGFTYESIKRWEIEKTRPLMKNVRKINEFFGVQSAFWKKEPFTPTVYVRPDVKEKVDLSENPYHNKRQKVCAAKSALPAETHGSRLVFKDKKKEEVKFRAVGCSSKSYAIIKDISDRAQMPMTEVADMLIKYALEFVEWE